MWPNPVIQKNVALKSLSVAYWGLSKISKIEGFAKIIHELVKISIIDVCGKLGYAYTCHLNYILPNSAQKMKISVKDFFCDQIRRKRRIGSHLLRKSLMESFIFCALGFGEFKTRFQRAFKRHSIFWYLKYVKIFGGINYQIKFPLF